MLLQLSSVELSFNFMQHFRVVTTPCSERGVPFPRLQQSYIRFDVSQGACVCVRLQITCQSTKGSRRQRHVERPALALTQTRDASTVPRLARLICKSTVYMEVQISCKSAQQLCDNIPKPKLGCTRNSLGIDQLPINQACSSLFKQHGHVANEHKSWLKVSNLRPVSDFMFSGSSACRTRASEDHKLKY